jgi:hypothetical protein
MGLFSRKPRDGFSPIDDDALPDAGWLSSGEGRYDRLINNWYGSPETIARGGEERVERGDLAAALHFFRKSIDLLHTQYDFMEMAQRRPGPPDDRVIAGFLGVLSLVRARRPGVNIDGVVKEVTHRLRTISTACEDHGLDATRYRNALAQLAALSPDTNVAGIFWRNPSREQVMADAMSETWEGVQAVPSAAPAGPTTAEILAEWQAQSVADDLARWQDGMKKYDAAPVEDFREMRASAELMCAALVHYVRGEPIFGGSWARDSDEDVGQTIWNVLVASLVGNDARTWGPEPERHVRLALAAAKKAGLQPAEFGGNDALSRIFDDKGNRMLMCSALSRQPMTFHLGGWFAQP